MHPDLMESIARAKLVDQLDAADRARLAAGFHRPSRVRAALGRRLVLLGTLLQGCIEEGSPGDVLTARATVSR